MRTVGSSCVKVLVAILEGNLDCLFNLAGLGLPGAQTKSRHLSASVELGDRGGGHGE